MSLFDSIPDRKEQQAFPQALKELKSNPAATLKAKGITIPDGMTDARQIINYMLQSGQLPQSRLQKAIQFMGGGRR